jgi:hypothetical protein
MSTTYGELSIRGRLVRVPMAEIGGRSIAVSGCYPRMAAIKDEEWLEGGHIADVASFLTAWRACGLKADVFSFSGGLAEQTKIPGTRREIDNLAVIDTQDFKGWWEGLPQEARKNTRRAAKRGVKVDVVAFDDDLVRCIKAIYDEAPIRQGRRFWHYGKDIETVRRENGTYLDRSVFLGAFAEGQLIGFIKWVRVGDVARIMQILCLNAHQDKRPIIALIAKAAEVCHDQGCRYLIYGKYVYGKKGDSSITEFKRRLGFRQLDYSRYHIALTPQGSVALGLGLHRGAQSLLPAWLLQRLLGWRAKLLSRSDRPAASAGDKQHDD